MRKKKLNGEEKKCMKNQKYYVIWSFNFDDKKTIEWPNGKHKEGWKKHAVRWENALDLVTE